MKNSKSNNATAGKPEIEKIISEKEYLSGKTFGEDGWEVWLKIICWLKRIERYIYQTFPENII